MKKNDFPVRVVWAVDPFHKKPKAQLRTLKAIRRLYGDRVVAIQPVSILPPARLDVRTARILDRRATEALARKNLDALFTGRTVRGLEAPRFEWSSSDMVTESTSLLLAAAEEEKAHVIAVSSHARDKAPRLFLGSFAESLVLQSPIPVLVVNPQNGPGIGIKLILFPTDFSEASRHVFQQIVRVAAPLGARLQLFHQVPVWSTESPRKAKARLARLAAPWIEAAGLQGVEVGVTIETRPGYALDAILEKARRHASTSAIAMASQSGRFTVALAGSLTRQVMRAAPCPVLIVHPKSETLRKRLVREARALISAVAARPVLM